MCDPYVKESFLTAISQASCRDILPCIVSIVDFSFKGFSLIGNLAEVWVCSEHSYRPFLCASESFTELCLIEM